MADNVILPGTGEPIATDQLPDGSHAQKFKLLHGAADSTAYADDPLSDAQLRATPVPVSGTVTASGAALEAGGHLASLDTKTPALGQALAAASVPVILPAATVTTLTPPAAITGFATSANQTTELTSLGAFTEAAPASDTASSGLNGRLQRLAQRLTSLLGVFPTTIDTNSGNKSASTLRVAVATDQPILSTAFPSNAKGTQGATGLATQDLKDSGRQAVTLVIDAYQVAATAETLMNTMQSSVGNAAPTTGLSYYTVPAGKRFRIQSLHYQITTTTGNTTTASLYVRARTNTAAAAVTTASPLQFVSGVTGTTAANVVLAPVVHTFTDGWELDSQETLGFTSTCPPYVVTTAAPRCTVTVIGYLY